jgi:Ca2+-binding RTX toxin-like protein
MAVFNGTSGNDTLTGTAGVDSLFGGSGSDILNGRGGADFMRGGGGNDRYFVFSEGEDVRETAGAGTDTVLAGISYTLEENFENLTLLGTASTSLNGFGNAANNVMLGDAGSNVLDGRGGNDSLDGGGGSDVLIGGTGNDRYLINSEGDVAFEAQTGGQGGIDTVVAAVSYRAAVGIENIILRGDADLSIVGNRAANSISGNTGDNRLDGGSGADTISGGAGTDRLLGGTAADLLIGGRGADVMSGGDGADRFRYQALDQTGDQITDFRTEDGFEFTARAFGGGLVAGALNASRFVSRANDNVAQDADDRFIFNQASDTLWFDANGSGAGGPILVADLQTNVNLTAEDIFLI